MHISDEEIIEVVETQLARDERVLRDIQGMFAAQERNLIVHLARVALAKIGYLVEHLDPADLAEAEGIVEKLLRKYRGTT